ncbi:hypothetical protein TSAR_003249 [Trichomalopsis sarcophagae]|uniref:Uncharacterized protein n=1 Tax=Trichomalopsis sarcophagae TaxID=543379 RepID=A0A232ENB0_9HYME|nr:hypothetical protein TSAR_003249 [Trichomalopsis sarcophagae]
MRTERLNNVPPVRKYYRGCARGTDGSIGLVFIHDSMLEPLSRCRQLYAYGTFKVKVYTNVCYTNMDFLPFMFLRVQEPLPYTMLYGIKFLKSLPRRNVLSVMGDFERSFINSGREKCPTATISGCEFHYKQVIIYLILIGQIFKIISLVKILRFLLLTSKFP